MAFVTIALRSRLHALATGLSRASRESAHRTNCLSHYKATLWRQAGEILCALDNLDRRQGALTPVAGSADEQNPLPTYKKIVQ
jgi:hypothetical protein